MERLESRVFTLMTNPESKLFVPSRLDAGGSTAGTGGTTGFLKEAVEKEAVLVGL